MKVPVDRKGPRAFPPRPSGKVAFETLDSRVLRGNPLGDPTERTVAVYLPPSGRTEGRPLIVVLAGFTGTGWMSFRDPGYLSEAFHQRYERLVRSGACGEAVLVAPDCLTAIGGSQYVNSSATGRYQDHLVQELVPWARSRYGTGRTGVMGQSSGGFGALHLGFEHPEVFEAVGSSSGDVAFDYSYLPDIPKAFREFRKHGGPEQFLAKLFDDPPSVMKSPMEPAGAALNIIAMAACYSPRPTEPGTFDLPLDLENGALLPEVWKRWAAFDPLVRVQTPEGVASLARSRSVHVTASAPDEWALDVGARWFVAAARARGLTVAHDEFEGGHFQSGPRFEALLKRMVGALSSS